MKQIILMDVSNIRIDRLPLDAKTLYYSNLIKEGVRFPPIKCERLKCGQYNIRDGRHRFLAHKLNGIDKIAIKIADKLRVNL